MLHETDSPAFDAIPVFYTNKMVVDITSFSPSAWKPMDVMQSWDTLEIPLRVAPPVAASLDQLCLTHERGYVEEVLACRTVNGFGKKSQAVSETLPWTSGAMLSATREAIANGRVAIAPCSGFHHAGHAFGGGFCTFNGLMVTAAVLLGEGKVERVGILDCDMHYGDGTDDIIEKLHLKSQVLHYTAGAKLNHPGHAKPFLRMLPAIVESFADCDVLIYQAGADPHIDDPLGGWLTTEDLIERDQIVFETAHRIGLPVAWNLAGGYQTPLRRVLDIHDNTLRACARTYLPSNEVTGPRALHTVVNDAKQGAGQEMSDAAR